MSPPSAATSSCLVSSSSGVGSRTASFTTLPMKYPASSPTTPVPPSASSRAAAFKTPEFPRVASVAAGTGRLSRNLGGSRGCGEAVGAPPAVVLRARLLVVRAVCSSLLQATALVHVRLPNRLQ